MAVVSRPAVSAPDALSPAALADARRAQPRRGLAGLLFVLPVAGFLAAGVGGPAQSAALLGPAVAFALPLVAMIAFWWDDWPGSLARPGWSGLYDTLLVVAGGLVLSLLGRAVAGAANPLPLAGGIFTVMLQLTLVCERWPLAGAGRIRSGLAALAGCWAAGAVAYLLLVRSGAVPGEAYGAWFTVLGAWQMVFYVALRGWPFARIRRRAVRLVTANAAVVVCGSVSCLIAEPGRVTAIAAAVVASVLLVSMQFEAWPAVRLGPLPGRSLALAIVAVLAVSLSWLLPPLARVAGVPESEVDGWVTHALLNALSLAVILHVAVWRRWPGRA
ncbi:hypothetical protein [Amycolatopsis sp. ATCC 39116]|uniref:hypothetical protein n=1 Tax=Amycolatopsis sp. (strain ATCC 39116 / 75iv2) TaxID=385957 RepID=UPI0002628942|nr:hypothetical protein [Amycolatopsis sp. ATCC 39116]